MIEIPDANQFEIVHSELLIKMLIYSLRRSDDACLLASLKK
ncbi:hypothetical protein ACVNPZ_15285 [Staphylococcus aureus]